MKTIITLFIVLIFCSLGYTQQLVKLKLSPIPASENFYQSNTSQLSTSFTKEVITKMGGLNDLDGMNNYFNIYGGKLIIHQRDIAANGIVKIILRKENGGNFYGMYPFLKAEITPIHKVEKNSEPSESE